MPNYKYKLQPYKGLLSRYTCPACGKRNKFTRYINTETNEYLSDSAGKCDREIKCGYHQTPKQYFESAGLSTIDLSFVRSHTLRHTNERTPEQPATFIPFETLQAARTGYDTNCLVQFLANALDAATATRLIQDYEIGSSEHWPGATVFWQLDKQGNIRSGKIMLYNATTGKRVKQPYNHVAWVHSALKLPDFNLQQCLFGEHLLNRHPNKPVALVESEKTAIIASAYLPQFVWLATGGLQGLNAKRLEALKGRTVTLFPDQKGYDTWLKKAVEFTQATKVTVSNMLEENCTDEQKAEGLDLADYLLYFDFKTYATPQAPVPVFENVKPIAIRQPASKQRLWQPPVPVTASAVSYSGSAEEEDTIPEHFITQPRWNIPMLEKFFAGYTPPNEHMSTDGYSIITNPAGFIAGHLATVRRNSNNPTFKPYYDRLVQFMEMVSEGKV